MRLQSFVNSEILLITLCMLFKSKRSYYIVRLTLKYRISHIFQTKTNEGDLLQKRHKNPKTYFWAKTAPTISIKQYLIHLIKHLGTPPATLILMMIYVERLLQSLTQAIACKPSFTY